MSNLTDKKTQKLFETYLKDSRVVIADCNRSSRTGLSRSLSNMGAKTTNISMCESYEVAQQKIIDLKPRIVLADYDLGRACGLALLQEQRASNPASKDTVFILVTGNTSQSAVAQAAEEDIDSFILKPYTIEVLRTCLLQAAMGKLVPSEYVKSIQSGKELLLGGKADEALKTFEHAKTLDPKPSLACFYIGQAQLMKKLMEEARGDFQKGLDYNKIHYKCLVGLFDLLMERKLYQEAYDVVKKLSQYFPANPKRLASVIRLAIMTHKVEDMEKYYQVFTNIDTRSEELTRSVCAGLVVCAKYYLKTGNNTRALELFKNAGVSSAGRTKILREIIVALCDSKQYNAAKDYIVRFPPTTQQEPDYLICKYVLSSFTDKPGPLIETGRLLLKNGLADPIVYKILIAACYRGNQKEAAQQLLMEAVQKFPDARHEFAAVEAAAA